MIQFSISHYELCDMYMDKAFIGKSEKSTAVLSFLVSKYDIFDANIISKLNNRLRISFLNNLRKRIDAFKKFRKFAIYYDTWLAEELYFCENIVPVPDSAGAK